MGPDVGRCLNLPLIDVQERAQIQSAAAKDGFEKSAQLETLEVCANRREGSPVEHSKAQFQEPDDCGPLMGTDPEEAVIGLLANCIRSKSGDTCAYENAIALEVKQHAQNLETK